MLTDLHHHLVFGVDDGPADIETSLSMLRSAREAGIGHIVCTSHDAPGERELHIPRYLDNLALLRREAERECPEIQLYTGSEVFCTPQTIRALRAGNLLTLNGSRNILVEFDPAIPRQFLFAAAETIAAEDHTMVLAHAERYRCLREDGLPEALKRDFGVLLQLNADTVLTCRSPFAGRWARRMIRCGAIDLVASDAHDPLRRPCRLASAHAFLAKHFSPETADRLCADHPLALLRNANHGRNS